MLTGSITARLCQSMTGYIVRNFARSPSANTLSLPLNLPPSRPLFTCFESHTQWEAFRLCRFMSDEASPAITRKMAHDMSEQLENSLQTTLIHQLQAPLVHTLSYGLKDAVPHFYYCTHCYYYGGTLHMTLLRSVFCARVRSSC